MSAAALDAVLRQQFDFAALRLRLDEELGTLHGLSWDDFVLLWALDAAGGTLATRELAKRVGLSPSALVVRLLPLEKTGLVARAVAEGVRKVQVRSTGRQLLGEARETAREVCGGVRPAALTPPYEVTRIPV